MGIRRSLPLAAGLLLLVIVITVTANIRAINNRTIALGIETESMLAFKELFSPQKMEHTCEPNLKHHLACLQKQRDALVDLPRSLNGDILLIGIGIHEIMKDKVKQRENNPTVDEGLTFNLDLEEWLLDSTEIYLNRPKPSAYSLLLVDHVERLATMDLYRRMIFQLERISTSLDRKLASADPNTFGRGETLSSRSAGIKHRLETELHSSVLDLLFQKFIPESEKSGLDVSALTGS